MALYGPRPDIAPRILVGGLPFIPPSLAASVSPRAFLNSFQGAAGPPPGINAPSPLPIGGMSGVLGATSAIGEKGSPLNNVMRAWNRRAASFAAAGQDPQLLAPVAKFDMEKVMRGGGAMTNIEAATATRARIGGKSFLQNPNETDEGGGIGGFLGNIAEDIGEIGMNLNPVKLVPALADEVVGFFESIPKINFTTDIHSPGEAFKNLSEIPGLRMLPGVQTGYRAFNDPDQIRQHPVQTFLDVLPLAMAPTRIAAKAVSTPEEIAQAVAKGEAAHQARMAGVQLPEALQMSQTERVLEVAARGRPLKTLWRAGAPEAWQNRFIEGGLRFKEKMGVAPWQRNLARQQAIMERNITGAQRRFIEEDIKPTFGAMTEAEEAQVFDMLRNPDKYTDVELTDPRFVDVRNKAVELQTMLADLSQHFSGHELFPLDMLDDETIYYANHGRQGQVRSAYEASAKEQARLADLEAGLDQRRIQMEPGETEKAAARLDHLDSSINSMVKRRDTLKAKGYEGQIEPPEPLHWKRATQNGRVSQAGDGSWVIERHRGGYSLWRRIDDPAQIEGIRNAGGVVFNALDEAGTPYAYVADAPTSKGAKSLVESRRHAARLATEEPPIIYPRQYYRLQDRIERAIAERRELKAAIDSDTILDRNGNWRKAVNKVEKQRQKVWAANQQLLTRFMKNPPANFQPMISERLKDAVRTAAEGKVARALALGDDVEAASARELLANFDDAWATYERTSDPSYVGLTRNEYRTLKNDVAATWLELAGQGYQPVWVHSVVNEAQVARQLSASPHGTTFNTPGQLKDISMDPTPVLSSVSVSMTAAASQYLQALWKEKFILDNLAPYAKPVDDLIPEINRAVEVEIARRGGGANELGMHTPGTLFWQELEKRYVRFTPDSMFNLTTPKIRQFMRESGELWIPKEMAHTAKQLVDAPPPGALARAATRVTSIFKIAVLGLSLKHMSDVMFSDTMLLAMRGSKDSFTWSTFKQAWDAVKNGGKGMPAELSRHMDLFTPDQLFAVAKGKTLGRIGKALELPYKFEEFINNVQRMMSFLGEEKKLLKQGWDEGSARTAALEHAQKTLLDLDSMVPIERTIIKQVFPFYSFMRYILKYTLTFPFDHPIRASIMTNLARMEAEDRQSGLSQLFDNYFFLGEPDEKGNITGVDVRSMNPFRDIGNFFTFSGFISQLHPLIGGGLKAMGVNPLTGTPELYPNLEYDPKTGRLVAQRKSTEDTMFGMLASVFPQVELLDYYALMTQNMRQLKAANPDAYKRVLYRNLFLPFTERKVNVGEELQKQELAKLEAARRAYSTKSRGYGGNLEGYNLVPFRGQLYPAEALDKMLNAADYYGGGKIPPSALLGPYRKK